MMVFIGPVALRSIPSDQFYETAGLVLVSLNTFRKLVYLRIRSSNLQVLTAQADACLMNSLSSH